MSLHCRALCYRVCCKLSHKVMNTKRALLQKIDRDTQKCAYKCCFAVINDNPDLLQTVFEDGVLVKEYTFAEVRENAEIPLVKASKQNGLK
ncbi:hypothetical protein P5673_008993 [Acropora cervicornis]|uniref:Uncharacterized protein n=1 Tax=Acropora cervicornis TaxID=6130 RepID=A0AAD9VAV0_ACRCE|nr:hypothetical protein P5673_008993 [Acropora cervicornis]